MGVQIYESPRRDGSRAAGWREENDRSLAALLRDLSNDSVHLIRQEAQLFRAETAQKLTQAQRSAIVLGAGGVIALMGALALVASLILLLALAIPAWLSALLVGAALVAGGVVALVMGKNRLASERLAPTKTLDSVKRDVVAVREAVR